MPIKTFSALEYMNATNYNTYCQNNGLKWLDTKSTSFGANFLTSNSFTTEFDSYRIVIDTWRSSTTNDGLLLRMRTAAGQYSGSAYSYSWNGVIWTNALAIGNNGNNLNYIEIMAGVNTRQGSATIEMNNVRTSGKPTMHWQAIDNRNNNNRIGSGFVNNTADYTGFDILTFSGSTMTCNVSVYGYRKQ
jgi:hypothetical protein